MDSQKVDMYLLANGKLFQPAQLPYIREKLLALDDSKWIYLQAQDLKDPVVALVISFFVGAWGIDRFYVGDTGLGVAKLLTCGGFGIWAIIDWFLIMDVTRQKNIEQLLIFLEMQKY